MKKNLFIVLLMASLASLLSAADYEYDISFPDYQVTRQNGHMLVDIPGCMQVGVEGEPLRPHYPVSLLLPPGETLDRIELIVDRKETIPLMQPLLPKQPDRPLSWGVSDKGFVKNEAVYLQSIYESKKINAEVQWFRGAGIVTGLLDPLTYYPEAGSAELISSATLRLTTKPVQEDIRLSPDQFEFLASYVQNPELLSNYVQTDVTTEKLLIITDDQFVFAFAPLIRHYKKYGIETSIISVSDILNEDLPGRDIPEKIRVKIKQTYLTEGLDYVLLGGNSNYVPHRGLSCQVLTGGLWESSNDIPADLYYAALDGIWDENNNDIFGEYDVNTGFDEADLLPELAVGRMPADNLSELQHMIDKSIRYQREPVVDELNTHTFFGEFLYADPESWGADYLELLIGNRNDNGYVTQGLPSLFNIVKWYDQSTQDQWDQSTVINELAQGTSFVHHDGHCNYTYMMKFYVGQVNDSDFATVNGIDHTLPVFYSHGCNCGGFDNENCIASRLVTSPYITVGGVFNSRFGWFNEGQTEGPSIHLHREFEHAIYGLGFYEFGWALSVAKIRTAPWVTAPNQHEQNAIRWNYYAQNILGDPVMRLYSDVPVSPDIDYDITELENGILKVSVSLESDPVTEAGLSVIDTNGVLKGFTRTNMNGYAEIDLSASYHKGDSLFCYITGENIIPADTVIKLLESNTIIPTNHLLVSNYPNPFNPNTTIVFDLPVRGEVTIGIYDLQGKLIDVIYRNIADAGTHSMSLDGSEMSSGIYICRVAANGQTAQTKLILMK